MTTQAPPPLEDIVAVAKRNPAGEPNVEAVGPFTFCGKLELDSCASAVMIRNALCVDPELRQDQVTRSLTVEGHSLLRSPDCYAQLLARFATCCDSLLQCSKTLNK
eukprot:jgi/Tetstr1/433459/TSEL_022733.t2